MPTVLLIIVEVEPFVLKQAFRVGSLEYIRSLLIKFQLLSIVPDLLLRPLAEQAASKFFGDADGLTLLDYDESFGLDTLTLYVLALSILLDNDVRYERLQVVLID